MGRPMTSPTHCGERTRRTLDGVTFPASSRPREVAAELNHVSPARGGGTVTVILSGTNPRRVAGGRIGAIAIATPPAFNLFGALKALRSLSRVNSVQEPARGLSKCLHALFCVVAVHVRQRIGEFMPPPPEGKT